MHNPIIAALDLPNADLALKLAREIAPAVGAFKIGKELFVAAGPDIVKRIRDLGAGVFLDLKFHDIPNTVARAVASAMRLDVQMLTVHTSGGSEMMRAAEEAAQKTISEFSRKAENGKRKTEISAFSSQLSGFGGTPLVLGVTVLTSLDASLLSEIGCDANVGRQVNRLAQLAVNAGLRGLVCSPLEIVALRQILPGNIQLVTPGIRMKTVGELVKSESVSDDQKRTLTPREAMEAGANWLVIGRPIYGSENPRAAAEKILQSVNQ